MAANSARINFKLKSFVNRAHVRKRIVKWKLDQLGWVGAYARGAMKKQIRPALKGTKKSRTVVLSPTAADMPPGWRGPPPQKVICLITPGAVLNAANGRPVGRKLAMKARITARVGKKGQGEGRPPRRGPTDLLRTHIYNEVDVRTESAVIGAEKFPGQPAMPGRVSVPELLNKGGIEIIFGQPVRYGPRPFVETILPKAIRKLRENIRKKPIK